MSRADAPEGVGPHHVRILRNAMTPLCDEHGRPLHFGPYKPVVDACSVCPARCCRLTVKVSVPDALHFCATLSLPFFAGLRIIPSTSPRAFKVDRDPILHAGEEAWPGTAEIALKRRDDGGCGFLIDIGGFERCGVYSARPSTCRLYPMTWTSDSCEGSPPLVMCPVPYAVTPEAERIFVEDANRSIEHWSMHEAIIEAWHAREGEHSVDAFLRFAIGTAAERMGIDASRVLDRASPFERLHSGMVAAGLVRAPTKR